MEKILEENYALNTLIITPDNQKAYITCVHGFWILDLTKEKLQYIPIWKLKTDNDSQQKSALYSKTDKEDYGLELSTEDYYITIRPCINLPK